MPIAISTDSHSTERLPNSEPMNTISADMPMSSMKVFIRLAVGCQVISSPLRRGFSAE